MQVIPFAYIFSIGIHYPLGIIASILFAFGLHQLANRYQCYGLTKNLLFGFVTGIFALGLFYGFIELSRHYGLHSFVLAQIVIGYGGAVFFTVMRRLVFEQRSPSEKSPIEGDAV